MPSKDFFDRPLKSLTLGKAINIRRSKNSNIRFLRNVTLHPMLSPFLNLKPAIDFFALVTTGFCPVIRERSSIALFMTFESVTASPTPILTTILSSLGTSKIFPKLNFSFNFNLH